jgi:ribosome-associated protein
MDPDDSEQDLAPSKSALKREMTARQALGEALCELSPRELSAIPLEDETLRAAIEKARQIHSRSALRRHRQYIGKLMRRVDPEPIQLALDALHDGHRQAADAFHELEALRDRLLSEGDEAMPDALARLPGADRQTLRQLTREARRDPTSSRSRGAARRLFRYLRELQEGA